MSLFELEILLGGGTLEIEVETAHPPYIVHGKFTAGDNSVWTVSSDDVHDVMCGNGWELSTQND